LGADPEALESGSLGERSWSSPAFTQNRIIIRGEKHVFCIEKKK
jgi:hypothetical protein